MEKQSNRSVHSILSQEDIEHLFSINRSSLMILFEYHNQVARQLTGKTVTRECADAYQTTLEYLSGYVYRKYRMDDISLQRISHQFVKGFLNYLEADLMCSRKDAAKYMDCLMQILIIALAGGLTGHPVILN